MKQERKEISMENWIDFQSKNWDPKARDFSSMVFGFMKTNTATYLEENESLLKSSFGHGVSADRPSMNVTNWMKLVYSGIDAHEMLRFCSRYDNFFKKHDIPDENKFTIAKQFIDDASLNPTLNDVDVNAANRTISNLNDAMDAQDKLEASSSAFVDENYVPSTEEQMMFE